MFGCQQNLIKEDKNTLSIIEYLCSESNDLYNCAVYYGRQIFFKTRKIVTGYDLTAQMKTNLHFKAGYASSMQQTCLNVGEAFKSFKKLLAKANKGDLEQKPRPPKYRKSGGLFTVSYPKKWLKLVNGKIRFPLGRQVKVWFGISEFFLPMPSNLHWSTIKEIRLLPRNRCFYAEFVYSEQIKMQPLDESKALGLDHGLNNWLTCVSNTGDSFIVDGKHLKSINQWYNKQLAKLKEGKPQGFWSRTLANITEKRNRQMRDATNKAARIVINYCLVNSIGTLVFGWNQGQKQGANLGKKNNQKFVSVPTAKLKNRIAQLCQKYGIRFIETEESYSSKASFLDNDELPKYGEKPERWHESGKRVQRGLYQTAQNQYINCDANGAANILRKVKARLELDLSRVNRGVLTTPIRVRLWANSVQESPRL
ncbi:transposase [Crocosphaera sp.]|uniref:RNA-guided endonuclease InsQ/TnpB family protein n=1 Tax=Crocosphaera sp. TaxID=2729996 RepID=UPI0026110353|nr:transposase [Crocosphaera sp.]MDJ0582472.1 transposase [Crocosphaera sp.]